MVIIPFKEPSIRAQTEEQRLAFSSLKQLKDTANSSIGYYISLGKLYRECGIFEVDEYEQKVSTLLPNCGGRTVKGYANLIWFTEQASTKSIFLKFFILFPFTGSHADRKRTKLCLGSFC